MAYNVYEIDRSFPGEFNTVTSVYPYTTPSNKEYYVAQRMEAALDAWKNKPGLTYKRGNPYSVKLVQANVIIVGKDEK